MGVSFKKHLTDVRMKHAKALLVNPTLKVHQIAEQVGYTNGDYFSKIFKEQTGNSPSEYRSTITFKIN